MLWCAAQNEHHQFHSKGPQCNQRGAGGDDDGAERKEEAEEEDEDDVEEEEETTNRIHGGCPRPGIATPVGTQRNANRKRHALENTAICCSHPEATLTALFFILENAAI